MTANQSNPELLMVVEFLASCAPFDLLEDKETQKRLRTLSTDQRDEWEAVAKAIPQIASDQRFRSTAK